MSVPAPKTSSRIAGLIKSKNERSEALAKEAEANAAKSAVRSDDKLVDSIAAAMKAAGLESIERSGADSNGVVVFKGTIPEAAEGQWLSFEYRPNIVVLMVRGSDKPLPSIPADTPELSSLIENIAVEYFATRLRSTEIVTDVVNSPVVPAQPSGKEKVAAVAVAN
jgi:hypothetical protein